MKIPEYWDGKQCPNPECPSPEEGFSFKQRVTQEMSGAWGVPAELGSEEYEDPPYTVGCIACKARFDRLPAQGMGEQSAARPGPARRPRPVVLPMSARGDGVKSVGQV